MTTPLRKLVSREYPSAHLANPARRYVNAASTDIRATFARIRAEQAATQKSNVRRIK